MLSMYLRPHTATQNTYTQKKEKKKLVKKERQQKKAQYVTMLAISLSERGQESKSRKKGWEPECKIREAEDWDPPVLLLPLNYISCTLLGNSVRNKTG